MTDKEIMDKEIIKGLERMSEEDPCGFSSDVLDLIKRQQEEIENALGKINWQRELLDDKCDRCIARDRAEAIKEFALKIKVRMHKWAYYRGGFYDIFTEKEIDDLVKEMVGADND